MNFDSFSNRVLLLMIALILSLSVLAQDSSKSVRKNSIFVEALGRGIFGLVGYERLLLSKKKCDFSASIGVGFVNVGFALPVSVEVDLGKRKRINMVLSSVNSFNYFPSKTNIDRRRYMKSIGRGCPPESWPLMNTVFCYGIGYKRKFGNRISCQANAFGIFRRFGDFDYSNDQCMKFWMLHPWVGLKFNYFI